MKYTLTLFSALLLAFSAQAVTSADVWNSALDESAATAAGLNAAAVGGLDVESFLDLTPKKYRELTGERLGVKGSLALKAAQKQVKKQMKRGSATDIPKGLYVVLAIFGWGWLAMGLMDDFEGNNWWVALILYILCWLPGFIYSLVKMKDYY